VEVNSLYIAVCCIARKTHIKHNALSVSEKLGIIKMVGAQPHVMHTNVAEQLSIPVSTLNNNNMVNEKNTLQQTGRKK
jgi:hypothetical protein